MAGKFMVSPDAKSSKGNDLQKELNRRSKGLTPVSYTHLY